MLDTYAHKLYPTLRDSIFIHKFKTFNIYV